MALTEDDKMRARSHMGYLGVSEVYTFVVGVPAGVQTQFLIEGALNRVLPQAEATLIKTLDRLDKIEEQLEENTENLAVTGVDEIRINPEEMEKLIQRYRFWQGKLGNILGCAPNPNDMRWGTVAGGGINVSVDHG